MVFVGPAPRQRPDLQPYPYRQHLSQEMQLTFHSALAEMCVAQPSNENVCTKFQTRSLFFWQKNTSLLEPVKTMTLGQPEDLLPKFTAEQAPTSWVHLSYQDIYQISTSPLLDRLGQTPHYHFEIITRCNSPKSQTSHQLGSCAQLTTKSRLRTLQL